MMTTMTNSKWNADAEMSMMGYPIAVESRDHLLYMVRYCLIVLKSDVYRTHDDFNYHSDRITANAYHKYNSAKDKSISYFVVNDSDFGIMMTFVRENKTLTLKSGKMRASGLFAWVENIDAPECSEAGYVFFEKNKYGKTVRIG